MRSLGPASSPVRRWAFPVSPGETEETRVCWLPQIPAWFWKLQRLARAYEAGAFLTAGGARSWPAWYLSAMQAHAVARAEFQAAHLEKTREASQARANANAAARARV